MAAPESAREIAYQTLWGRIVTMELKPGAPLNDRQLAQEMGISRTPVREALIMLNIAHMVVIKPQSGTYVAPIDLKLMRMEQFARFTLEKEMLTHVCRHCRPAHLAAYRANIREYEAAAAAPETPLKNSHMLEIDNRFHRLAFEFCGMEEHFDHMLSTFKHIERLRMFSLMLEENFSVPGQHGKIVDALEAGDLEALEQALREHLTRYRVSVDAARKVHPDYFIEG